MPDKNGSEQAAQGQSAGSSRSHPSSERVFWRDCEPPRYRGPVPPIAIHTADRPHITGGIIMIGGIIGGQCQEASSSRR